MGNPLAPTLANFFLGNLEKQLFLPESISDDYPAFYTRYVDDVFCVFRGKSDYNTFLSKLNSLHRNLRFTYEMGGKEIPFLDTSISLGKDKISSTIHRKTTDTNVLLHHAAVAPLSWKRGLIKCFLHRADVICSEIEAVEEEYNTLKDIFYQNGYPHHFFTKVKHEYMGEKSKRTDTIPCDDSSRNQKPTRSVRVPYVGKISKSFGKRLKSLLDKGGQDTRIIYQTTKVQKWFSLKDPDPKEITS